MGDTLTARPLGLSSPQVYMGSRVCWLAHMSLATDNSFSLGAHLTMTAKEREPEMSTLFFLKNQTGIFLNDDDPLAQSTPFPGAEASHKLCPADGLHK